jgi:hypothetical protein
MTRDFVGFFVQSVSLFVTSTLAPVVDEERAAEKRMQYRKASAQGIPERVTDRMLKRIAIFSGIPLLLGFSTGRVA